MKWLLRQCATLVALTGEAWVLREVFPPNTAKNGPEVKGLKGHQIHHRRIASGLVAVITRLQRHKERQRQCTCRPSPPAWGLPIIAKSNIGSEIIKGINPNNSEIQRERQRQRQRKSPPIEIQKRTKRSS